MEQELRNALLTISNTTLEEADIDQIYTALLAVVKNRMRNIQ